MSEEDKTFEDELAELDLQLDVDMTSNEDEDLDKNDENDENEDNKEDDKSADNLDAEDSQESEDENSPDSDDKETDPETDTDQDDKTADQEPAESNRIEELLARIDKLQGQIPAAKSQETDTKSEDKPEVLDFLKDLELDDVHSKPEIFNQILHQVATFAYKQAEQNITANIPKLVQSQLSETLSAREMADRFYDDNKDLRNVRNVVKACAEQVAQENSDWTLEKVLKEAADKTRETLGIVIQNESDLGDPDKAGFANTKKSGGKRNKQQKISALQQELDEL